MIIDYGDLCRLLPFDAWTRFGRRLGRNVRPMKVIVRRTSPPRWSFPIGRMDALHPEGSGWCE